MGADKTTEIPPEPPGKAPEAILRWKQHVGRETDSQEPAAQTAEAPVTPSQTKKKSDQGAGEAPPKDEPPKWKGVVRHTITFDEPTKHAAAVKAMQVLADVPEPKVFRRADRLVRAVIEDVIVAPPNGKPRPKTKTVALVNLGPDYLDFLLRNHMNWQRRRKREPVPAGPGDIPSYILGLRGEWPFHSLNGLISTPTLRPDGSLLIKEGYDEATGLLLVNSPPMPTINLRPTREEAEAALKLLANLLGEFPFVDEASKSVALSLIISLVVRGAIDFLPLHMISAPTAGTGKSYLNDCASYIATGQLCPVIAATDSYEEQEKRIGSALLAALSIVSLDNLNRPLESNLLCQATSQSVVLYRVLGGNEQVPINCRATTITGTGQNIRPVGDLVRRVLLAQMDARIEQPWTRKFERSPVAEIAQNRGRYIAAALTIPLAYLAAGSPSQFGPLDTFAAWSQLVRSPLGWLGCADPVLTIDQNADPKIQAKIQVFTAMAAVFGKGAGRTADQIIQAATIGGSSADQVLASVDNPKRMTLRYALLAVAAVGKEISALRLGQWLGNTKNSPAGGLTLRSNFNRTKTQVWSIEDVPIA